ncbi:WbqC family protein [Algibacter sp. 2305UL17-15]|uniref:WbqC family protein n=1 Tax=Algibacter sp. 2305UL17-15 TaxID=3231268 RepID=UPI003457782A
MKVAIMQPYLFPYIGYFQLINCVDTFVIYDNIEYTKKGWINRNRILVNGTDNYFTIPLKKSSDFSLVSEKEIAENFKKELHKILNRVEASYRKAPYFETVFPLLKKILSSNHTNLFKYIYFSLMEVLKFLEINTKIIVSSEIDIDHTLKSQSKVIAICEKLHADTYINAIGGMELYHKNDFKKKDIVLGFIKSDPISYTQFDNDFIPWLSIIDVMMFNSKGKIQEYLKSYSLQ